jgi:hypothetical protein
MTVSTLLKSLYLQVSEHREIKAFNGLLILHHTLLPPGWKLGSLI